MRIGSSTYPIFPNNKVRMVLIRCLLRDSVNFSKSSLSLSLCKKSLGTNYLANICPPDIEYQGFLFGNRPKWLSVINTERLLGFFIGGE